MNLSLRSNRPLASLALVCLATFPVVVVALNLVQHDRYDPVKQAISELALGRYGWLMNLGLCAIGTGILAVAILIRRTVARSVVAPLLLTIAALLLYTSAYFHTDLTGAKTTTHGQIHNLAGLIAFILVIVSMFVTSRRFRRDPAWRRLASPTLIWAAIGVAAFFLIPALGNGHFGLAQRIFVATWLTWLLTVAAHARRLAETTDNPTALTDSPQTDVASPQA